MSNKIFITNNTQEDVLLIGAQLTPGKTQQYTSHALNTLMSDPAFRTAVNSGAYTVNNGTENLPASEAAVYLSSLESGTNVIDVKDSLGYASTDVKSADVADYFTINPLQANNWILTVTEDTIIEIAGTSGQQKVINFSLTVNQDDVGSHKVTLVETLNVTWDNNRSSQMPDTANSSLVLDFSSTDGGLHWRAKERFRWLASAQPTYELYDSDNQRRPITIAPSPVGLSIISPKNIESAKLSYRLLANSSAATTAVVEVKVDGVIRHSANTPNFYQDQLVTQDISVDAAWNIRVGSVIEVIFRELSGALTIEVKGDIQTSTLSMDNIIEGEPTVEVGVVSSEDKLMTTTLSSFGLVWPNDTGDGFLSATANLAFNVTSSIAIPLHITIMVDGAPAYSTTTGPLAQSQRLTFAIPVDDTWGITSASTVTVLASVDNASAVTTIMGSVIHSALLFTDIVPGEPSSGGGDVNGTNNLNVELAAGVVTTIIDTTAGAAIPSGTMDYVISLRSNFTSGCEVKVNVDGVTRYTHQYTGVSTSTIHTETAPVDATWAINEGSVVTLTARETTGNPAVIVVVEGALITTSLTIANA